MQENSQQFKYDRVMVIDDTHTDRYIAEHYLKKCLVTADVLCKSSAFEALEYLSENVHEPGQLPSLILLDIRLPGMDGFEFLEEFEKFPAAVHNHCPIIMLSSSIDPRDLERAKNNPFVRTFISKPLNKEKVQDI